MVGQRQGEIIFKADGTLTKYEGHMDKQGVFHKKKGAVEKATYVCRGRYLMITWQNKPPERLQTADKGKTFQNDMSFQMESGEMSGEMKKIVGKRKLLPSWWKDEFKKHWEPLVLKGNEVTGNPGSSGLGRPFTPFWIW